MKEPITLIILDGWGIGEKNELTNPFVSAKTPAFDYIHRYFPAGILQASGISVGLGWNDKGDSKAGHLTIGSGRIIYQNYLKISLSIKNGSFFKNEIILKLLKNVNKESGRLHLVGLLSSSHSKAEYWHIISLVKFAKKEGIKEVFLHLFGDGIEAPQKEAASLIKKLENDLKNIGLGKIATFSGRMYGMDETRRWNRTKKVYEVMVEGKGRKVEKLISYIETSYKEGKTDFSIEPVIVAPEGIIKSKDGIFFFNYSEEGLKQIFLSLNQENFSNFERKLVPKTYKATMTPYFKGAFAPFAFSETQKISLTLSEILSQNQKVQLKISETEKYPHITYYLNGFNETPFFGEQRVLIPSYLPHQFKEHPEMRAEEITERIKQGIGEMAYDLIVANYPNADTMSHLGDFSLAIKAIEIIDNQIGKLLKPALKGETILIITSDHGAVEEMRCPYTGRIKREHSTNPVPVYLVGKKFAYPRREPFSHFHLSDLPTGMLTDIAPTILELLNVPKPAQMGGESLIGNLK